MKNASKQVQTCLCLVQWFLRWSGVFSSTIFCPLDFNWKHVIKSEDVSVLAVKCEAIKQNETYVGNIDFEIWPKIVWNSFYILLFSAWQSCAYLWNNKSILMGFSAKQSYHECFHKRITKPKFDTARHKTHFAWSHHKFTSSIHKLYVKFVHREYYDLWKIQNWVKRLRYYICHSHLYLKQRE